MASTTSNKNSYEFQHHKPKHNTIVSKYNKMNKEFQSTLSEYFQEFFIPWEDMKMNCNNMRPNNIMLQGWIVADVKVMLEGCWDDYRGLRLEFTHWYWVLCQKEFPNFASWSPVFSTGKVRKFLWVPLTVYLAACRSFKQRVATQVCDFLRHLRLHRGHTLFATSW
jgi:hypothetical protein